MAKATVTASDLPVLPVDWGGLAVDRRRFKARATIFAQGDVAESVMYVERGDVRLSVLSHAGKEAVVAVLRADHFFGEGCLAGQPLRMATAKAVTACTIIEVPKPALVRHLHGTPAFAESFLRHMLARNIRIEEDLVDHLFNSSEKRLARTLLLLARYGEPGASHRVLPALSQQTLADIVGTTRSRVNFFLNKFRRLGLIEYNGGLKVNDALLGVVLRD